MAIKGSRSHPSNSNKVNIPQHLNQINGSNSPQLLNMLDPNAVNGASMNLNGAGTPGLDSLNQNIPSSLSNGNRTSAALPELGADAFPTDAAVDSMLLGNMNGSLQPIITTPDSIISTPGSKALTPDPSSSVPFFDKDNTNSYTLSKYNRKNSSGNSKKRSGKSSKSGKSRDHQSKNPNNSKNLNNSRVGAAPKEYYTSSSYTNKPHTVIRRVRNKKSSSSPPKRPAFVMKLWNMVNDPSNSKYISWMPDGKAFQVNDRENFMKFVLPKYFKHNNFASFVRQLNMYGWHKIQDVNSGSLLQGDEVWQFENLNFIRDREDLLDRIVRNKPSKESEEEEVDINALMSQLEAMRKSQKVIEDDLRRVRQDNEMLWKENYMARERHKAQSETLDKILRFLATVYGSNSTKFLEHMNQAGPQEVLNFAQKNSPAIENQSLYGYKYGQQQYNPPETSANRRLLISNEAYSPRARSGVQLSPEDEASPEIQEIPRGPENRNTDSYINQQLNLGTPTGGVPSPRGYYPDIPTPMQVKYQSHQQVHQPQQQQQQRPAQADVGSVSNVQLNTPNGSIPNAGLGELNTQGLNFGLDSPVVKKPSGRSASLTSNPEELMGNIHDRLNKNQGTLKQVNEWISKLSGKPTEEVLGSQDDLSDFLLPQSLDGSDKNSISGNGNPNVSDLTNKKINELYDEIEGEQAHQMHQQQQRSSKKRKNSTTKSGSKKQRK